MQRTRLLLRSGREELQNICPHEGSGPETPQTDTSENVALCGAEATKPTFWSLNGGWSMNVQVQRYRRQY